MTFSGVTLPPVQEAQIMTFHTINVYETQTNIVFNVTSMPFMDLNLSALLPQVEQYQLDLSSLDLNTSAIARFNGTLYALNVTSGQNETLKPLIPVKIVSYSKIFTYMENLTYGTVKLDLYNTTQKINGEETEVTVLYYLEATGNYTVTLTTTMVPESSGGYSHVSTFIHYTSPEVNISDWFGDWIVLNFTHTLTKHYNYVAQALVFASEKIYTNMSDPYQYYLHKAYPIMASTLYKLTNTIKTELKNIDKPVKQSIALAIDPLLRAKRAFKIDEARGRSRKTSSTSSSSGFELPSIKWKNNKIIVNYKGTTGTISFWNEFMWHFPWYKLHITLSTKNLWVEIVVPLFGKITIKTTGTLTNTIKNLTNRKAFRGGVLRGGVIEALAFVGAYLPAETAWCYGFLVIAPLAAYLIAEGYGKYGRSWDYVAYLAGFLGVLAFGTGPLGVETIIEKIPLIKPDSGTAMAITLAIVIIMGVIALIGTLSNL